MAIFHKKKKKNHLFVLLIIIISIIVFAVAGYRIFKSLTLEEIVTSDFAQKQIADEDKELFNYIPKFLGFTKPMTYLLLFQNNTEMRPGGGFIGVYAIAKLEKGRVDLIQVQGTEVLDKQTPDFWKPPAPKPISEHLKADRWYFRDSNWSPDFKVNAERAIEFYKNEGGIAAGQIEAVIAITPTVLEELLQIVGGFTVEGIYFTPENLVEKLEYEVEYGYSEKGIAFTQRKQIFKPFMLTLMSKIKGSLFTQLEDYLSTVEKLAKEKHILVYSLDKSLQKEMDKRDWSGRVKEAEGDYLLWVDANLAALKTDHAMERELKYSLVPYEDGRYLAKAQMVYKHKGVFDWRTTRYRNYARAFVPLGSELVSAEGSMKWDRTEEPGEIDQGAELGKQWFGTFISIEPGETKSLSFTYLLPPELSRQVGDGLYTLFVQKQAGTIDHALTVELNFDKNIKAADPAEAKSEWGDEVYRVKSDLREDREFSINF